ncbi:Uncharacterised protein [Mycobacteroides abscessus subsp. abscessus]|nr:Uncharacterised protein [Mycobacteroides abscessus subsp. abscessus]
MDGLDAIHGGSWRRSVNGTNRCRVDRRHLRGRTLVDRGGLLRTLGLVVALDDLAVPSLGSLGLVVLFDESQVLESLLDC